MTADRAALEAKAVSYLRHARCDVCPLGAWHRKEGTFAPVPADLAESDTLFLGDRPAKFEAAAGVPFVGPLGTDIVSMLESMGENRDSVSWDNVVRCRYPADDGPAFLAKLKKQNRTDDTDVPTPQECCAPATEAALNDHEYVVTFGSEALKALGVTSPVIGAVNHNPTLDAFQGAPALTAEGKPLIATRLDWRRPKGARWRLTVREDIEKALRYFAGESTWVEPEITYQPSPDKLQAFLLAGHKALVYDVESLPFEIIEGKKFFDARLDRLAVIGVGNSREVMVVPLLGIDGHRKFYTEKDEARIKRILCDFFTDPDVVKVGHNAGYYDEMQIETHLGVVPAPLVDTHLMHKLAESEYRHRLGWLGSRYTDAPAWKSEHSAVEAETDEEWWWYNAHDIAVNALVVAPIRAKMTSRKHTHLLPRYERLQDMCVSMHKLGVPVSLDKVHAHIKVQEKKRTGFAEVFTDAAGKDINPNSVPQLVKLLYDEWHLPIQGTTATGEPSTDDASIRGLLASPIPNREQKGAILALRNYRTADKLLTSYLYNWLPGAGFLDADHWIHPDFNPAGTVGWRFSSADPNFQVLPSSLKDCFEAPDEFAWVSADYDQLEGRLAAGIAGAERYLDMLDAGEIDPHNFTAELVFGDLYWDLEGAPPRNRKFEKGQKNTAFSRRRDLIKRFFYAALYKAYAPTILDLIQEAEDSKGKLMFLDLGLREIRQIHEKWKRVMPEFPRWWDRSLEAYRRRGYVQEPIWGLRRYIASEEDENDIINFPVQGGGGAIVHTGTFRLLDALRFNPGEGLALQTHDSLDFLVERRRAQQVADAANELLTVVVDDHGTVSRRPVKYTANAGVYSDLAGNKFDEIPS